MRSRIQQGSWLLWSIWPTSTTTIRGILGNRTRRRRCSRVGRRRGPRPRRTVPRSSSPGARRSCRRASRATRRRGRRHALRGDQVGQIRRRRPRAGRSARRRALHPPRTTRRREGQMAGRPGGARPRARTAAARRCRAGRRTPTAASQRVRRVPIRGTKGPCAATRTSKSLRRRNSFNSNHSLIEGCRKVRTRGTVFINGGPPSWPLAIYKPLDAPRKREPQGP